MGGNERNMKIKDLQNKKIAMLGFGIENYALVKYILNKKISCEITVCDSRSKNELSERYNGLNKFDVFSRSVKLRGRPLDKKIIWQFGKNYDKNLEKFDILFRSPGWPLFCPNIQKFLKEKKNKLKTDILSSSTQLFFDLCPTKNIIGVTGTKGKGTTASLIYEILKNASKKVWLGGNIGVAPFDFLAKIKKTDWVILELSSFQLEDIATSPRVSVITNLYPEHLAPADPNNPNYHKTLAKYWQAKMNIFKSQSKKDFLIINKKLESKIKNQKSKKLSFSYSDKQADCYFINKDTIKSHDSLFTIHTSLLGEHNKENIAAAIEVAKIVKVKQKIIKKTIADFKGLPHRLELARECRGVKYYDDSFSTTPESTIIALKSFNQPIIILLGGADKGADFSQLAKETKKQCKFIILLNGVGTQRIEQELIKTGFSIEKIKTFFNINQAIKFASKIAVSGDAILLSTACASFGMFKNYKERGNLFKQAVKNCC